MQKADCENLYREYLSLKEKLDNVLQVHEVVPGKPREVLPLIFGDMVKQGELAILLRNQCKECLNIDPSDWFNIERDARMASDAPAWCEVCSEQMKKIGPFASAVRVDGSVEVWDGIVSYQCVNEKCSAYLKIIEHKY